MADRCKELIPHRSLDTVRWIVPRRKYIYICLEDEWVGHVPSRPLSLPSRQVVHQVFRHLLCEEGGVDFKSLGAQGFWCLWRYFSVVNTRTNALSRSPHKVTAKHIWTRAWYQLSSTLHCEYLKDGTVEVPGAVQFSNGSQTSMVWAVVQAGGSI